MSLKRQKQSDMLILIKKYVKVNQLCFYNSVLYKQKITSKIGGNAAKKMIHERNKFNEDRY